MLRYTRQIRTNSGGDKMKSKQEILDYYYECVELVDGDGLLELDDWAWAHLEGQKKALGLILEIDKQEDEDE